MSDEQKVVKHDEFETTKPDQGNNAEISQEELGKISGGWSGSNENPTES